MANKQLQNIRGMPDIVPKDEGVWIPIINAAYSVARDFDFHHLETPIAEDSELFIRSIGETSDIVEKEMFYLKAKEDGVNYVLRPECTAPAIRAYIQHGWNSLPQPIKTFYVGQMFRHERPQAGRMRQFHQLDLEIIGSDEAVDDAVIINVTREYFRRLGVENIIFQINSIGDKACRGNLKNALKAYYRPRLRNLCPDCQRRFNNNPFRLLDCKNEKCQEFKEKAPVLIDHLCDSCKDHFKSVLKYLDENEVPYELDNTLVRGLDYYTRTVFEATIEGKQHSFGGGGRYDELATQLGSKIPVPAVGVALGLERIAALLKELKPKMDGQLVPDVFLVAIGEFAKAKSIWVLNELTRAGISTGFAFGRKTLKSQLELANALKIKCVLLLGQREVSDHTIIFKDMVLGSQEIVKFDRIVAEVKNKIK